MITSRRHMLEAYEREGELCSLQVLLTYQCPLKCLHCYQKDYQHVEELSTQQWVSVFREFRAMNGAQICLTGGEPFARKDFFVLLEEALDCSLEVSIKTSGYLLSDRDLQRLGSMNRISLEISLYGSSPETHDVITGRDGSFHRTLNSILELQKSDMNVAAAIFPMRKEGTVQSTKDIKAELHRQGIEVCKFGALTEAGAQNSGLRELMLTEDELSESYFSRTVDPNTRTGPKTVRPEDTVCKSGITILSLLPDGTVLPCAVLNIPLGNVTTKSLEEIWTDSDVLKEVQDLRWKDIEKFDECELKGYCGFCFGVPYTQTGEPTKCVPDLCRDARARKTAYEDRLAESGPRSPCSHSDDVENC